MFPVISFDTVVVVICITEDKTEAMVFFGTRSDPIKLLSFVAFSLS